MRTPQNGSIPQCRSVLLSALLLVAGCAPWLDGADSQGAVQIPYTYGDTGMVAMTAGQTVDVTWENAPDGARLYLLLFQREDNDLPLLIGVDVDSADGVVAQWKIPEYTGGTAYGIALYADRTPIYSRQHGLIYSSGKAPPEGVCSVGYASLSGSPEVYTSPGGIGWIGYLRDYAPVIGQTFDSDGLLWLHIDLSQPSAFRPLGNVPAAPPETAWVYGIAPLYGDCTHLDEDV